MRLFSDDFTDGQPIPGRCAFCIPDPEKHVTFGGNENPSLGWEGVPAGAKSLVLICHDSDVPSRPDDVNQAGRVVPGDLARIDFHHWVLVDVDVGAAGISSGEYSRGVTPRGKAGPAGPDNARQGTNDFGKWFADDADMGGDYYGYDGPCPPWNDALVHHYHFTLYALDCARCPLEGTFGGDEVLAAIEGHVLAKARLTGTYTLNEALLRTNKP